MTLRSLVVTVSLVAAAAVLPVAAPAATAPVASCQYTPTPENLAARPVLPPLPVALATGSVTLRMSTNHGPVVMKLDRANAPCGVHNFVSLALQRFYHGNHCWRLTDSERLGVLQCGDIYEVEKGGPGYEFPDEVTGRETYPRGTIAMGNQGPGTNGSEFFIVHSFAKIDPVYTVLGKVVRGMNVLDRIVAAGITPSDRGERDGAPKYPVIIHRVAVTR